MTMRDFRYALAGALLIGALGGLLFGLYDVNEVISQRGVHGISYREIAGLCFYLFFLYPAFGALGLGLFGGTLFCLASAGGLKLRKTHSIALQAGAFALIAVPLLAADKWNAFPLPGAAKIFLIPAGSVLAAGGISVLALFLLKRLAWKRIALGILACVLGAVAVLSWRVTDSQGTPILKNKNRGTHPAGTHPPNILWIILDTARADRFSCYGYSRTTTPCIDTIAREGVRYANAVSPAPWTLPSHASMMTGLFPSRHRTGGTHKRLEDGFTTIAEVLRDRGYNTACFSNNNHYFGPPTNLTQGFDTFVAPAGKLFSRLLLPRAVQKLEALSPEGMGFPRFLHRIAFPAIDDSGAAATNRLAESTMDAAVKTGSPFFVCINYIEAHDPYGDTPDGARFLKELNVDAVTAYRNASAVSRNFMRHLAGTQRISERDMQIVNALYDGDIHYLDAQIGRLVEHLRLSGQLDKTLLIITSDHGENLGERNMTSHVFDLHRTLTHVPLIIRYPALFPAAGVVERIVQTVDIFPTILEAANIRNFDSSGIQGYSLLDENRPQMAIAEADFTGVVEDSPRFRVALNGLPDFDRKRLAGTWLSVQTEGYECITQAQKKYLYDLSKDPGESVNLAAKDPQKAEALSLSAAKWLEARF